MCGIAGTIRLDGLPADPVEVGVMLGALVHRGPDASGITEGAGAAAGIRRLRVVDLESGDQPIDNEDRSISVVFNGEIYGYGALRSALESRGHRFRTRSDTEVLVHLWEDDGPSMVERLNGMFAFCIVDRRRGEVFLARDRVGIKPLYLHDDGAAIRFASEIPALRRVARAPVDPERLGDLLLLQYLPGDGTPFAGIRRLPPAHWMRIARGRVETRRYWELPSADAGDPDADEEIAALLREAVELQLVADVPVGVFLSGGIDSTIVASLATTAGRRPVESFSVGFEGAGAYDEREWARKAAAHLGAVHHERALSAGDVARLLPAVTERLGEPILDPALLPTFELSRFARERVTVVLTGEGADELFAGYRRHRLQRRLGWMRALPGLAAAGRWAPRLGFIPRRAGQALEALAAPDAVAGHLEWSATLSRTVASELFEREALDGALSRLTAGFARYFDGVAEPLEGTLAADVQEWLPNNLLAKVDRATMAFSLEARVPFLDHRIVERAARIPASRKIENGRGKAPLRRAFAGRIPREILERPKRGFDLPLDAWLSGPLRAEAEARLRETAFPAGSGIRREGVRRLLDDHLSGRRAFGLPLWNLLALAIFLERHG